MLCCRKEEMSTKGKPHFTTQKKHTRPRLNTKVGLYDFAKVGNVETIRDGVKVKQLSHGSGHILTLPRRSGLHDYLCQVPMSSGKPCLQVEVESLPKGGIVTIGLGEPGTFREQPGWSRNTLVLF